MRYPFELDVLFWADPRSKDWVKEEFKERVSSYEGSICYNPGKAWEIRKDLWEKFLVGPKDDLHFDYTYSTRMGNCGALGEIIQEIKRNPDSRQLILSIWVPRDIEHIGGKKRIPCSIYYQFLVRDNKLHIIYSQRSADIITHFGNDVWLAWELMTWMANQVGIKPGWLYHNIGSLHAYKKDWDILKGGLTTLIQP